MTAFAEYLRYDAIGLADLVRRREVHPRELVEAAIARIERHDPRVRAMVHTTYDAARAAAERPPTGPFGGVPFVAKDLVSTWEGLPQASGCRLLAGWIAPADSEIVRRYRASGVILVGKTSTPEFGLLPVTEPELFGPTRNPWNLERTPGGSSGGTGAAVAAGFVPIGGGGDGGGSLRIPASCCGLFGLKPTRGRTPQGPLRAESWHGFAIEHVLTRSVRDSAAMLDAIAGSDEGEPYPAPPVARPLLDEVSAAPGRLRVAFTRRALLPAEVHPDCVRAVDEAAALLASLGHEVVEEAPVFDAAGFAVDFVQMLVGETAATVRESEALVGRRARRQDLELATHALALLGRQVTAEEYALAVRRLKSVGRAIAPFFQRHDVLLTPTLGQPPLPVGELGPQGAERALIEMSTRLGSAALLHRLGAIHRAAASAWRFAPFTAPFNVTGQPACSVPLHWNPEGLPIGVQLVGRFGDEATLLRLAAQLEEARPWKDRWPRGFEP